MKHTLTAIAFALVAMGASAQDTTTVNTGAQSGSTSGANSGSVSGVQSSNSGNTSVSAVGNQAGAQSGSQSTSGAQAGSQSGALGNVVNIDQRGPVEQTINSNGTSTNNVKYSGTVENRASGGYTNTENTNVHYSGTQTIKNVPGIAMSGPASGPCTGASGGLGVAGPGFGVGLNGAKVDDGCTVRENTRILGQLYQSLDSNNPAKPQVQAALVKSMAIIEAMNDKIGADYLPKPVAEPKKAEAPLPAPVVTQAPAATPIMMPATNVTLVAPPKGEPTDPYIRARMGLPKLAATK